MPPSKSIRRPSPFIPDERQREAIEHVHGPMLVLAGAGTGKTSVLTHRIERLVREGHAYPHEILALTYTRNAANEMRDRVGKLLGGKEVNAATFHDYCLDLLKRVHKDFGVLDDKDLWIYLRRRLRDLRLEHYIRAANVAQFLNDLLDFVSRCHDELVTPEKYAEYVARLERKEVPIPRVAKSKNVLDDAEVLGRCREIARVFTTMERWLAEENLGTFSHMITRAHSLLHNDANVLAEARARARFILADEFQDANFAQIQILARLVGAEGNIFAVGDPDQAIYRFRGASSAAFELFDSHFPNAKRVVLEKNRRSTTPDPSQRLRAHRQESPRILLPRGINLPPCAAPVGARGGSRKGGDATFQPASVGGRSHRPRRRRPRPRRLHSRRAKEIQVQMVRLRHSLSLSLPS